MPHDDFDRMKTLISQRPAQMRVSLWQLAFLTVLLLTIGCRLTPRPGTQVKRHGDEIMVCGQLFRTGTRVVLWTDPNGYDAYRVERRFGDPARAGWTATAEDVKAIDTPNRYGSRAEKMDPKEREKLRGGGWDLGSLQSVVDQFVLHFDACGTSRECFNVLHDHRGLSVHFMLDLDGTIYQTLDLKERAWHATTSNTRSVGVEIANIGAYDPARTNRLGQWYQPDAHGRTRIVLPTSMGDGGILNRDFIGRPARSKPVLGRVQGRDLVQYDFTPEQYEALAKLTATLCRVFPKLRCEIPRSESGKVLEEKIPDERLSNYQGILGHFHIQTNKVDPGPAFQWEEWLQKTRRELAR